MLQARMTGIVSTCLVLLCGSCAEAELSDVRGAESLRGQGPTATSPPDSGSAPDSAAPAPGRGLQGSDSKLPLAEFTPQKVSIRQKVVQVGAAQVHYLEGGPALGTTILLLHGGRFSAETWRDLGTLEKLARAGHRFLAIDIPGGVGKSPAVELSTDEFLGQLMDALGLREPVLVSPSMSGRFSLPLLTRHPERFSAWVPIAPAGLDSHRDRLSQLDIPTLIVWGSEDRTFPVAEARELAARLPRSQTMILEGAGHPCYLDRPDEFHARLLRFLAAL